MVKYALHTLIRADMACWDHSNQFDDNLTGYLEQRNIKKSNLTNSLTHNSISIIKNSTMKDLYKTSWVKTNKAQLHGCIVSTLQHSHSGPESYVITLYQRTRSVQPIKAASCKLTCTVYKVLWFLKVPAYKHGTKKNCQSVHKILSAPSNEPYNYCKTKMKIKCNISQEKPTLEGYDSF